MAKAKADQADETGVTDPETPETPETPEPETPPEGGTVVPETPKRVAVCFRVPYHRYAHGDFAMFDAATAADLIARKIAVPPELSGKMADAEDYSHDTDIG